MATSRTVIIIFGAAVLKDGSPSGALRRRVAGAISAGRGLAHPLYMPTGGKGRFGDAEAYVMKQILLDAGIDTSDIICDAEAKDTVASAVNCAKIIRAMADAHLVAVCSDRYHVPRCMILLRVLGIRAYGVQIESGRKANGSLRWLCYYLRECAAIIVDTPMLILQRRKLLDVAPGL